MDSIIIKINLQGEISGRIAHTSRQKNTVSVGKDGEQVSRVIKHSDRQPSVSTRSCSIPGETVESWVKGDCPYWEEGRNWKKMSKVQKVISHVSRFDEGYGVSFDFLEDGEGEEED